MNMESYWIATEERLLSEAASLGELLESLRGRVSPALIGDREWERVVHRAGDLPVTMAAFPFGFELPLHDPRPRADFGVSVVGGSRSATFFEERARSGEADSSTARIAGLLRASAREASPLRRVAGRKMLLEYDIDPVQDDALPESLEHDVEPVQDDALPESLEHDVEPVRAGAFPESLEHDVEPVRAGAFPEPLEHDVDPVRAGALPEPREYDVEPARDGTLPEPGIFLYPEEWLLIGDGRRARDLGVVVDAIASAAGWEPDAAERRQAERVYSAMRPETTVRAVGVFPSRARGLRLAVTGFTTTRDVTEFLERVDWPGSSAAVHATLSPLEERGAFAHMGVHFDLRAHGTGPRLGISLFARKAEWLKDVRHWTALIDGMREQRLAVAEKLSALAGSSSGAEALFGKTSPFVLLRGIHHIKLSLVEDRVEQTKAYVFLLLMGSAPGG